MIDFLLEAFSRKSVSIVTPCIVYVPPPVKPLLISSLIVPMPKFSGIILAFLELLSTPIMTSYSPIRPGHTLGTSLGNILPITIYLRRPFPLYASCTYGWPRTTTFSIKIEILHMSPILYQNPLNTASSQIGS